METETLPEIMSTTDYDQFEIMQGNRHIDVRHVEKLKVAMLENLEGFKSKPAVVNEHNYIIDGQHRWTAAKQLQLPFFYVVGKNMNLGVARDMNILQKQWTLKDYAQSYADGGNKNYVNLLNLANKFPSIAFGQTAEIAADFLGKSGDFANTFKSGEYVINDIIEALDRMENFAKIRVQLGESMTHGFVRVMLTLLRREEFDVERLITKLNQGAQLTPRQTARDNYREIEEAYNYHMQEGSRARLY